MMKFQPEITKMTPEKTKMSLFLMTLTSVWLEMTYLVLHGLKSILLSSNHISRSISYLKPYRRDYLEKK